MGGIADTDTQYVGILAQDMQEIAPYMISSSGKDEYLNFDSNAVIYMLINAIKEQQNQIEKLEALIAE
jgi:ABC-type Fe3+-citrate transport system substrate-binding protein